MALGPAGAFASVDSPRIEAVELRSDTVGLELRQLWEQIELGPGDPLDPAAVRRTLLNLHATGIASDVSVSTRPVGTSAVVGAADGTTDGAADGTVGVVLVVSIVGDYRLEAVDLEGRLGVRGSRLRSKLDAQAGSVLHEDQLLRGVFRLQDFYREEGFRDASVRLEVDLDDERKTARAIYRIDSGERALVGEVIFEGELGPFSAAELLEEVSLRPDRRDSPRDLELDREKLRSFYVREGFRRARVQAPEESFDPQTNTVTVHHQIEAGPRVEVEVVGAELDWLRKRDLLPFMGPAGFDDVLVEQGVERIRRDYQSRGYYDVDVSTSTELTPAAQSEGTQPVERLVLTIVPGELTRLATLELEGNRAFFTSELLPLIATPPRGGVLVDAVLEADLDNLRSFYVLQGFAGAEIGPPSIERTPLEQGARAGNVTEELRVVVPIVEGSQRTVSDLSIDGVESLSLEELEPLPLRAGGPFHPQHVEETVRRLRAAYEERGFDRAIVDSEVELNGDESMADVRLRVVEGRRTVVDRVIVRGNLVTRSRIIDRNVGLEPGDPLSRSRLLEAQRRLYRLGVFERVEVEAAPRRWRGVAGYVGDGEAETRDVVVRVSEGERWRLGYGAGYDSEDGIGGLFVASYANVLGRASTLRLDSRASQREQRFRLLWIDRLPGRRGNPLTYALYYVGEDVSEFRSIRYGAQTEALALVNRVTFGLLFDYRDVDLVDRRSEEEQQRSPLDIDRELLAVKIASLTGTVLWDRRDNPLSPTDGFSSLVQLEEAFPLFAADERFTRGFFQLTGYQPLGPFGTVAASVRLGAIESHRSDQIPEVNDVPVAERYFAGGATSHRAYERDELGIEGETIIDGVPVGGNGLALVNLDYRFPLFGDLGGVIFGDTGNVWSDWREMRIDELESGVGVGIRYDSPVGPIRLEVGWKLDPLPGQDREVYFLSIGNPF